MMLLIYMLLIFICIEIFVMTLTQQLFYFGIIILTFSLIFFVCLYKALAINRNVVKVMAIFCMIWGSLVSFSPIIGEYMGIEEFGEVIFLLGLGLMFLLLGFYMGIIKILRCNKKVQAEFIGAVPYRARYRTYYTPRFQIRYNHQTTQNTTGETYTLKKINKEFHHGEMYDVYIDPKDPLSICVKRRLSFSSLLMIVLGILLIMIPFF